jgi:hypothetical protein
MMESRMAPSAASRENWTAPLDTMRRFLAPSCTENVKSVPRTPATVEVDLI